MRTIKWIAVLLILVLAWISPASAEEPIVLTVGIAQSTLVEDYDTNALTLLLEEHFNVDLQFVFFSSTESERLQKLDLMVMAGGEDLPDILMFGLDMTTQVKYANMGMLVDLTDYYNGELDSVLTERASETLFGSKEELLKYVTCYNGRIYTIPCLSESINNCYTPCRMNIYEPWLIELGLDMPASIEEFADVLRAFKNDDPNGNGMADEIPYVGYAANLVQGFIAPFMSPFIYTQENFLMNVDGDIEFVASQDAWREGLLWIRSLFDEELISPLTFTQDQTQLTALLSGEETIVGAHGRFSNSNMAVSDKRRIEYLIIEPLEGPKGLKQTVFSPRMPKPAMEITKNCEYPELAFQLGDYKLSELLTSMDYHGEYGIDWDYITEEDEVEGIFTSIGYPPTIKDIGTPTWGTLQNKYWGLTGPYLSVAKYASGQAVSDSLDYFIAIGRSFAPSIEYANHENGVWGLIFSEEENAIVGEHQIVINDYVQQSLARFVTRDLSIEEDWDTYVSSLEALGLEQYLAAIQSAYDRMNQ